MPPVLAPPKIKTAVKKKKKKAGQRLLGAWCGPMFPIFPANISLLSSPVQKISRFKNSRHKEAPPGDRSVKWNSPRSKVANISLVRPLKIWLENSYGKWPNKGLFRTPRMGPVRPMQIDTCQGHSTINRSLILGWNSSTLGVFGVVRGAAWIDIFLKNFLNQNILEVLLSFICGSTLICQNWNLDMHLLMNNHSQVTFLIRDPNEDVYSRRSLDCHLQQEKSHFYYHSSVV